MNLRCESRSFVRASWLMCMLALHATLPALATAGNRVAVIPIGTKLGESRVASTPAYGPSLSGRKLDAAATAALLAELSKIRYLRLVDQGLITERMAAMASTAEDGDAAQRNKSLGELLSADWLVTASLLHTEESGYEEEEELVETKDDFRTRTRRVPYKWVSVTLSADMIDAASGTKFSHVATGKHQLSGRGSTGRENVEDAVVAALPAVASQLARDLASHIGLTGTVLTVEETMAKKKNKKRTVLVIGLGEPDGIIAGMRCEILRPGGTVADPSTGQQLARPERKVGECKVTEVGSETSYAVVRDGHAAVGDIVRLSSP